MVKRTTIEEDDGAEREREAEELAQLNADEDGALFRVTDELRATAGVTLMITCMAPPEKEGFVNNMPVSEYSAARLKKLYGPGTYRIRVQGPKGFLPGGGTIKIADIQTEEKPTDLAGVFELMDRRERERKEASNDKWNRILELSIPVLGSALAAWIARGGSNDVAALVTALKPAPGPTLADLASTLQSMKALTAPVEAGKDPLDQIARVMELVKGMGGDDSAGGGKTNWLDVLRDLIREAGPAVGPMVGAVLQSRGKIPPGGLPSATVRAPPTPVLASPAKPSDFGTTAPVSAPSAAVSAENLSENRPQNEMNPMLKMFMPVIKENLSKVAQWAVEDRNPVTYAELFLDELPPNIGEVIPQAKALEYCQAPNWFEVVCDIQPIFKGYKKWCEEFRAELIEILKLEPPPMSTEPESGESQHPMVGE